MLTWKVVQMGTIGPLQIGAWVKCWLAGSGNTPLRLPLYHPLQVPRTPFCQWHNSIWPSLQRDDRHALYSGSPIKCIFLEIWTKFLTRIITCKGSIALNVKILNISWSNGIFRTFNVYIRVQVRLYWKFAHSTQRLNLSTDQPYMLISFPTVTQILKWANKNRA